MKKIIMVLFAIGLFTSCSSQKQLNAFGKSSEITEITILDYIPLHQSYLPDPIGTINNDVEISELTSIINRSRRTNRKREAFELMGGPETFTYEIRFNGKSLNVSQIYILIDGENIYISSIELFNQDKSEYDLYLIRENDINVFLDKLGISN